VRAGDRLLLATDGLSRALPPSALGALLARPETTAGGLVGAAVAAGARDDVTALLATVGDPASGYAAPVGVGAGELRVESSSRGRDDDGSADPAVERGQQAASPSEEPGARTAAGR
jgi:hypothetical protein